MKDLLFVFGWFLLMASILFGTYFIAVGKAYIIFKICMALIGC